METVKILDKIARKNAFDMTAVFSMMLDSFIDVFLVENIKKHNFNLEDMLADASRNCIFYECLAEWIALSDKHINEDGCYDHFGAVYEEAFQSSGKASKTGQFFTPMPICQMMAMATTDVEARTVDDCACGSGRLLLAHWSMTDKTKYHYYTGTDIDPVSVKMCALNLMINGMLGRVTCGNTLEVKYHYFYEVNEIRYPLPTTLYSLRKVDIKK